MSFIRTLFFQLNNTCLLKMFSSYGSVIMLVSYSNSQQPDLLSIFNFQSSYVVCFAPDVCYRPGVKTFCKGLLDMELV